MLGILLAFDVGTKHLGVAVGHPWLGEARPLEGFVYDWGKDLKGSVASKQHLSKILERWKPGGCLVGYPHHIDGARLWTTSWSERFVEHLRLLYKGPIHLQPEGWTTRSARERIFERQGARGLKKGHVDAMSAALILEGYFQNMREKEGSSGNQDGQEREPHPC